MGFTMQRYTSKVSTRSGPNCYLFFFFRSFFFSFSFSRSVKICNIHPSCICKFLHIFELQPIWLWTVIEAETDKWPVNHHVSWWRGLWSKICHSINWQKWKKKARWRCPLLYKWAKMQNVTGQCQYKMVIGDTREQNWSYCNRTATVSIQASLYWEGDPSTV